MNNKLISSIKPFYVMEILEKAQEYERNGRSVSHLEIGEPTEQIHPLIKKEAKRAIDDNHDKYSNSLGLIELRELISRRYKSDFNLDVSTERIIVTNGSSAALILALISILEKDDEIILIEPYYPCYPQLIKIFGGKIRVFRTSSKDGYQVNLEKFKDFLSSETKAVIINSPSNPTGVSQNKEVIELLSSLDIKIISDEIYQGLNYLDNKDTILNYSPEGIVVNGFSKFYSMTGWRLGYLIVPEKYIRVIQKLQQNMYICAPTISQYAAIGALNISEEDISMLVLSYRKKRDFMMSSLQDMGIEIGYIPDSSFYIFVNMENYCTNSLDLSLDILDKVGLGVAPGLDFGPSFKKYIRFSYSSSFENIEIGLGKMKEYIKECK